MQGLDSLLDLSFYYTLHNGYCVKWKCETTPASTTPWKCEGSYSEQEWTKYEGKWTNRIACVSWRYPHFVQPHWNCCEPTSHAYQACVKQHWPGRIGLKDYTSMSWFSFNCRTELGKTTCQYECKRNTTSEYCNVVPKNEIKSCSSLSQTECGSKSWCTRSSSTTPPLPRPPVPSTPGRCVGSYTTPAKCEPTAEHGRYEYSNDASFACENFNGFSDECNNTLWVRIQLDGYWVPKEVAARFSDYWWFRSIVFPSGVWMWDPSRWPIFAKCSDELAPLWNACPYFERVKWSNFYNEVWNILDVKSICVFKNSTSQSCNWLTQTECGKQSWCTRTSWGSSSPVPPRPWRPKLPPPPIPWSPFKVVKCIDEQWNERPDAYCANAGVKPVCDAEWACAVPTQPGTQWCSNPTTKDSTSLCAQKNNIEKCNNTLEVVKHCLSSRRNCASDQYRFAWGPEMAIKATISGEVAKSLKWNPSFNLYFSDLPDEKPFWYELLGACVRGEPKASVSCKSISWRYDSYCSTQRDESSCETVNIYEKKDALSWPITVWLFKHSGQCSISMYNFNDWEKQDSSSCPSIHKKFFKYVDSCEWGVRKEVVCQSKGSKAILDDSSCDVGSKPDYNMLCWWREFPSMPSTPPTPSTPSTTALYMLYYDPYKWLDEQQLKQCRQSWTCLTNCSIVWSFAKIYDDQYWWGSRKALSTEFFCAHGPQWGAKPYTIKPIYIKGDWRANRYLGTSLSSYSFWLDADHTIPAPDGVYNTNLTSAHASDANESFYEEKVHWMKILNGKIQYNEVIQQK